MTGKAGAREGAGAGLKLKAQLMVGDEIAFGPGKADLLSAIEKAGSISGGARLMGLSYRRAWMMVETMNRLFDQPLVATRTGGRGGASITASGSRILADYRALQSRLEEAAGEQGQRLVDRLAP